jgi:hypothetical protein
MTNTRCVPHSKLPRVRDACLRFLTGALALLALVTGSAHAAPPPSPAVGWIEIAHFDGTVAVTAATYTAGLGSFASANYAAPASSYDALGNNFVLAVVMGSFTDYFRPALPSVDLEAMLSSHTAHQWSNGVAGPYVTPTYYNSQLGGSAINWSGLTDGRSALSFWGTTTGMPGGCCQSTVGGGLAWGQSFNLYLLPVPEPLSAGLMAVGLLLLALHVRRPGRVAS